MQLTEKTTVLVIKQHITMKLVNLLSNQYTDYQINTILLLICNYTIFHPITHNYKAVNLILKSYESHTSTIQLQIHQLSLPAQAATRVEIYPSAAHPLTQCFSDTNLMEKPNESPPGLGLRVSSLSSVGTCTPSFRRFPCPLFFTWFSTLFIIVSTSGTTFLPPLDLPFSVQAPP